MVSGLGLACPILSAVFRIDVFLFSWQSGDDIRGSHLLGSATSKGCDYSTLAKETQRISDAVPPLCRLSRNVSWPVGPILVSGALAVEKAAERPRMSRAERRGGGETRHNLGTAVWSNEGRENSPCTPARIA